MKNNFTDDTIAAISTPAGTGGIGIVRLSGPQALSIADKMFLTKTKTRPSQFKSYTVRYGWVIHPAQKDRIIDEALLTVMRAPKSYTCEDVVEISCHGGIVPLREILSIMMELGARLAEPGEFTKRAFLNGRIDLTQAEAVLDIIQSRTDAFLRVSTNQLKGELTIELENIREQLMAAYTEIEAIVNFPEDDIDAKTRKQLTFQLKNSQDKIDRLITSGNQGRILKEGIRIVLCGKPNVGKSSLLNLLLKQPRAIVSPLAGTTRDTIEESAQLQGIPLNFIDTAGILEPRDMIEEEAVRRSRLFIQSADLTLLVLNAASGLSPEDEDLIERVKEQHLLVVLNKSDLPAKLDERRLKSLLPNKKFINVSALTKTGQEELEKTIVDSVLQGESVHSDHVLISNIRHLNALKNASQALEKGRNVLEQNLALEVVSEEIKSAVNDLDTITGRNIDADLLDQIFSQFCIGK